MKELEVVGKNIEQAIENGLVQLGLSRDDVNIKIKDAGGMFKKAKVVLEYEEKETEKEEVKQQDAEEIKTETNITIETKLPKKETELEDKKIDESKISAKETKEKINPEKKSNKKEYSLEKNEQLEKFITEFIDGLCQKVETTYDLVFNYTKEGLNVDMKGSNVGKLIGYRGEGLTSLQHMLNALAGKENFDTYILLDIENYKEKRKESLIFLAEKMANKVLKTGKNSSIEPMNSYERLIIHSAVADMDGVITESVGEGNERHIVFKLKK